MDNTARNVDNTIVIRVNKIFRTECLTRDNLRVGTVIRIPASDGSVHGFNDTVIESVDGDNVGLARPYVTQGSGSEPFHYGVERFNAPLERLLQRAVVVYEGNVVNVIQENR